MSNTLYGVRIFTAAPLLTPEVKTRDAMETEFCNEFSTTVTESKTPASNRF